MIVWTVLSETVVFPGDDRRQKIKLCLQLEKLNSMNSLQGADIINPPPLATSSTLAEQTLTTDTSLNLDEMGVKQWGDFWKRPIRTIRLHLHGSAWLHIVMIIVRNPRVLVKVRLSGLTRKCWNYNFLLHRATAGHCGRSG